MGALGLGFRLGPGICSGKAGGGEGVSLGFEVSVFGSEYDLYFSETLIPSPKPLDP